MQLTDVAVRTIINLIGGLLLTVLPSAAFAQTAGVASSGAGSTPGTSSTGNTIHGTVAPRLADPALPLPSTSPTQRATTGVIENQQMLDKPQDQSTTIQSNPTIPEPSDMPAAGTLTTSRQESGGTPLGAPAMCAMGSD